MDTLIEKNKYNNIETEVTTSCKVCNTVAVILRKGMRVFFRQRDNLTTKRHYKKWTSEMAFNRDLQF